MKNWSELIQQFDTWGVVHKLLLNESLPGMSSPEGILRLLGWVHLYTASGVHIYAFLEATEGFIRKIPRLKIIGVDVPIDWLRYAVRLFVFASLLYLWKIQNFRFGFLRPMVSFALRQAAEAAGFRWRFLMPLLVVAAMDGLIGNPFSGRLHFYLAVGGGMITLDLATIRTPAWVKTEFKKHVVLAIGSWVWIAVYELCTENRVAVWTPLWSLVSLPLLCGVFYPLLASTFLGWVFTENTFFQEIFIRVGALFNHMLTFWIEVMNYFEMTFFFVEPLKIKAAFLMALVLAIIFWFVRSYRVAWFGMFLIIGIGLRMFFEISSGSQTQEKIAIQLDVGQGDALLIHQDFRVNEMIDVGSGRMQKPDKILLSLVENGAQQVNGILLTHLDEDHYGMLPKLSAMVPIRCVETHPRHWKSEKGKKLASQLLEISPSTALLENNCVRMFNPVWIGGGKHGKGNSLMAGSVVQLSKHSIYVAAGDADQKQEEKFIGLMPKNLKNYPKKILKMSHHGSKYSSSQKFIQAVGPTEAWISVGSKNRYAHPHPAAVMKFMEKEIPVYRTDMAGSLRSNPIHPDFMKMVL